MTSMYDSADPLVRLGEGIWDTETCGTLAVAFKLYRQIGQTCRCLQQLLVSFRRQEPGSMLVPNSLLEGFSGRRGLTLSPACRGFGQARHASC